MDLHAAWVASGQPGTFGNVQRRYKSHKGSAAATPAAAPSAAAAASVPASARTAGAAASHSALAPPRPTAPASTRHGKMPACKRRPRPSWPYRRRHTGGDLSARLGGIAAFGGRLLGPAADGAADVAAAAASCCKAASGASLSAAGGTAVGTPVAAPSSGLARPGRMCAEGLRTAPRGSRAPGAAFQSQAKGTDSSGHLHKSAARMRAHAAPNT